MLNKSVITNTLSLVALAVGLWLESTLITNIGLFALAGAVTNAIAVHMLFEKVPLLYGSGVIPRRFTAIKVAIRDLMMSQFFTPQNITQFLDSGLKPSALKLDSVIEQLDISPMFKAFVITVEESSFGSMLAMFGGSAALAPLEEPFTHKMKQGMIELSQSEQFNQLLQQGMQGTTSDNHISAQIEAIIEARLNELTPQLVKEMVANMIRLHLGWLVVWGGVFGGLIGALAHLVQSL